MTADLHDLLKDAHDLAEDLRDELDEIGARAEEADRSQLAIGMRRLEGLADDLANQINQQIEGTRR